MRAAASSSRRKSSKRGCVSELGMPEDEPIEEGGGEGEAVGGGEAEDYRAQVSGCCGTVCFGWVRVHPGQQCHSPL